MLIEWPIRLCKLSKICSSIPQGRPDVYRNITETGLFAKKQCIMQSNIMKKLNLLKASHEKVSE